MLNNKIILTVG